MAPKLKLDQQSEMQMKLSELDKLQKSNIESMVQKATSDLRKKFEQGTSSSHVFTNPEFSIGYIFFSREKKLSF